MQEQRDTSHSLCPRPEDHIAIVIIYVWFILVTSAGAGIMIFTALMARITKYMMDHQDEDVSEEPEPEDRSDFDLQHYVVVPQEIQRRKKSSQLADIAEDDESEISEGENYRKGSSYSVSNHTISISSSPASFSRSLSTADCYTSGNSLTVPGKSTLKRTESQSRADYVLKVRQMG